MPKKILSIDDSRMVHMVVSKSLRAVNVEVVTAINGQEGVERAERERPDLILLDDGLPVLDGVDALVALKNNPATREIPVVLLGADSGTENLDRARQLGALDVVPKPFTSDALIAVVSHYLALQHKAAA